MSTSIKNNSKYKISYSNVLGRYLVADRDIAAGEVILCEKPIVVGPGNIRKNYLCFACMRSILSVHGTIQYFCSKCNVAPLCGIACEIQRKFHSDVECELLKKNKDIIADNMPSLNGILLCLRLWLLTKFNKNLYEQINQMESHVEKRRNSPVWKAVEIDIISYFHRLNLVDGDKEVFYELIQQICGILDVNTFELRTPNNINELHLRGLYIEASLMAHKCRGNTFLTVDDEFQLTVYANSDIKKDEIIFFNYTSSLLGFAERRAFLLEGKYFCCDCSLCQDPSEDGSNISTILCSKCKKGHVLIEKPLETPPYLKTTIWRCKLCGNMYRGCLIKTTLDIAQTIIKEMKEDNIIKMEALLEKLLRSLHKNHFLILLLKQKLLAAYREEALSNYTEKKNLLRMINLHQEVMSVVEILEPGMSRLKAILLYEMHFPMIMLANREYTLREISAQDFINKLREAEKVLKMSLTMLILEPTNSPEGCLAKKVIKELGSLRQNISDVLFLIQL